MKYLGGIANTWLDMITAATRPDKKGSGGGGGEEEEEGI